MRNVAPRSADASLPDREGLRLLRAEQIPLQAEWTGHPMRHLWHEFVYVAQGRYAALRGEEAITAREGEGIYYPPNCPHQPQFRESDSAVVFMLQWEEPLTGAVVRRPARVHDATGRLLLMLRWMWDVYPAVDEAQHGLLASLLHAFLAEAFAAGGDPTGGLVRRVRHYLQYNMDHAISLDELATFAGVSKYHLIRVFRDAVGTTPMRYVQALRVSTAISLLQSTDLPLKTIARRVGIASPFHLSHLVCERTGVSPRQLRAPR